MKKFLAMLIAATMVLTLAVPVLASSDESSATSASEERELIPSDDPEVRLSFASFNPSGNAHEPMIQYALTEAYYRSGGTIKTDFYPGGTLCGQADMVDGIKNRVTDMGMFQVSDNASAMPELAMAEKPGVCFSSSPSISSAVKEYIETYQPAEMEGLHFLCCTYGTKGCICSNAGPIHTPEDLKGQTIRATGLNADAVSSLGAVPSDLAFADCYEALRTGVVDGIMTIRGGLIQTKLYEVVKYGIDYPLYNTGAIIAMNEEAWESLTPNQQEALQSAFDDAYEISWKNFFDDMYKTADAFHLYEDLEEYYYPTDEEIALFSDAVSYIAEDYAKTIENGDEILQRWLDLAAKYNEEYPAKKDTDDDFYIALDPFTGERLISVSGYAFSLPY